MKQIGSFFHRDGVGEIIVLFILSALVYLPFLLAFGYYKDDWYVMYAAGAGGAMAFHGLFEIDRPLRTLVMVPAYTLFGASPVFYGISAYIFRTLGAASLYWLLNMLWTRQKRLNLIAPALFLVYPGFLSQPNAIDYQSHIAGLSAGLFSVALTARAVSEKRTFTWAFLLLVSVLLGWLALGQMEWYIGLEAFRWLAVFLLVSRAGQGTVKSVFDSLRRAYPALAIAAGFLYWRIFIFKGERGATDVDRQLGGIFSDPVSIAVQWMRALGDDMLDSLLRAWFVPLRRLSVHYSFEDWLAPAGIASLAAAIWLLYQRRQNAREVDIDKSLRRRGETVLLGLALMVFGLLPVIMVGRSVDFQNYSRYTLVASVGVSLLLQAGLSFVSASKLRNVLAALFLVSAALTHYANGLSHVRETREMQYFWWQVSWRIPQMTPGTTLLVHYPTIVVEEDYFVWGPASLIYYPESMHPNYPQPGIYAILIGNDTVEKIVARAGQEFNKRRGIRTYSNYRNVLILSQPSSGSCMQVIDGLQPAFSSYEDKRFLLVGAFSDTGLILTDESSHTPPYVPFGAEPPYEWCYYYQKADLARQRGDWDEVIRLGAQAAKQGFAPYDLIEWMPFLQAYALTGNTARLVELAPVIRSDLYVAQQVCQILGSRGDLADPVREAIILHYCE